MLRLPSLSARLLKKVLRRYRSLFGRRFWGLNFGRRTGPYKMASTVPCLHGPVELLLTGLPHSFFKQFCEQTNPKNGSIFGPQNRVIFLNISAPFDAIFCVVFRLPSATDVVFLHAC